MTKITFIQCLDDGTIPLNYTLEDFECHICYCPLDSDTCVKYQHDDGGPWCLATQICGDCLGYMIESQSVQSSIFVDKMVDLQDCVKLLKSLLNGTYGVPTRLFDLVIFPHANDAIIPNSVCPQFGRKNEVAQLMIGSQLVSPCLKGAPETPSMIRDVISLIISRLTEKLEDYDGDDVTLIRTNLDILKKKIDY